MFVKELLTIELVNLPILETSDLPVPVIGKNIYEG